jgi:hypothetical protein
MASVRDTQLADLLAVRRQKTEGEGEANCVVSPGKPLPVDPALNPEDWKGSPEEFEEACRLYQEALAADRIRRPSAQSYPSQEKKVGRLEPDPGSPSWNAKADPKLSPERLPKVSLVFGDSPHCCEPASGVAAKVEPEARSSSDPPVVGKELDGLDLGPSSSSIAIDWKQELVDCLPRERAIEIIDHMSRCERDRMKAAESVQRLTVEVDSLHKAEAAALRHRNASVQGARCCSCRTLMLTVFLASVVALLAGSTGGADGAAATAAALLDAAINGPGRLCMTPLMPLFGRGHRVAGIRHLVAPQASAIPSPQEEVAKPTGTACDDGHIARLETENEEMREQLARLQNDIDDAIHNGRD